MHPMNPVTKCGFALRYCPINPIFPNAFCSAWSRTEHVLIKITSAASSSPVIV